MRSFFLQETPQEGFLKDVAFLVNEHDRVRQFVHGVEFGANHATQLFKRIRSLFQDLFHGLHSGTRSELMDQKEYVLFGSDVVIYVTLTQTRFLRQIPESGFVKTFFREELDSSQNDLLASFFH